MKFLRSIAMSAALIANAACAHSQIEASTRYESHERAVLFATIGNLLAEHDGVIWGPIPFAYVIDSFAPNGRVGL